jgi:lycopene beta-cyclase
VSGDRFDAVIAGGGLSGLSLAAHLAAGGWQDRSVLVVDDASARPGAVCWGFWSAGPGLLDAAVSRTYRQVRVHAGGASRVLSLGRYAYRLVRRPDLTRLVTGLLEPCQGYRIRAGRVLSVRDGPDAAQVVVDGYPVSASWAFDSVSAGPPDATVDARLAFTGWEVECARPVFDPDTPVLFDFRTPQAGRARFVYVLPDDAHRALVEFTEFVPRSAAPPGPATRDAALAEYLSAVLDCGEHRVLRAESAVLPLRVDRPRPASGRVLPIGAAGGLIKASTGYGYQRIQRHSAAITASLTRHGHPFDTPPQRRRYRLLDAVLLEVLDRDPGQLERAFARLFAANPAERVLRFLDEDSRLRDEARLIASMPPGPYLRAVASRLAGRARPKPTGRIRPGRSAAARR